MGVTRSRPALLLLLAILLGFQSGAALAHCLRGMAWDPLAGIEICTAEGRRALDHGEAPQAEAAFCPACHALPAVTAPEAPTAWQPVRYAASIAWAPLPAPSSAPRARAPPGSPRAPPLQA